MKRFIFLAILCSLALGMGAQTAKEEIFADVHRSAANYYAYPVPSVEQTAPPAGYKPFLSEPLCPSWFTVPYKSG